MRRTPRRGAILALALALVAGLLALASTTGAAQAAGRAATGKVNAAALAAKAVRARHLAPGSVRARHVARGSLRAHHFAPGVLPAGVPGAEGPQGPTGAEGPQGPAGPSLIPVAVSLAGTVQSGQIFHPAGRVSAAPTFASVAALAASPMVLGNFRVHVAPSASVRTIGVLVTSAPGAQVFQLLSCDVAAGASSCGPVQGQAGTTTTPVPLGGQYALRVFGGELVAGDAIAFTLSVD